MWYAQDDIQWMEIAPGIWAAQIAPPEFAMAMHAWWPGRKVGEHTRVWMWRAGNGERIERGYKLPNLYNAQTAALDCLADLTDHDYLSWLEAAKQNVF